MSAVILIIDDRAVNREFLSTLLGYAGYRVLEACSGIQAMEILRSERPALIISDVLMPEMDGIEFANRLHADPAIAQIPLIFYTATYRLHEARALAQTCGVSTVLAKPAEPRCILDTVAGILKHDPQPVLEEPSGSELNSIQLRLQQVFQSKAEENISFGQAHALSLRLAALLELSMELSAQRDPEQLLSLCCRAAQHIMNVKRVAIGMDNSSCSNHFTHRGLAEDEASNVSQMMADGSIGAQHSLPCNCLIVPVKLGMQTRGWIYLTGKLGDAPFAAEDEEFAATLAAQLAPAYENLLLFEEIRIHAGKLALEIEERKRAVELLQESEMRFRQLAENIDEAIFLTNPQNSEMLYISTAYEKIWGRSCQSLIDNPQSWMDTIHPDDLEMVSRGNEQRTESGRFDFTYRIVRPDASIRWIRARGFPIADETGKAVRMAGIAEDITEQHMQLQHIARLGRINALLSAINSAIVRIHDRDELFHEACRVALKEGGFSMAWIGMIDPDTLEGRVIAWAGCEQAFTEKFVLTARSDAPGCDRPPSVAVMEMRPVICNAIETESVLIPIREELLERGHRSLAVMPLITDDCAVGMIALFSNETGFFDDLESRLLNELAGDLSFALKFIGNEEQLSYLAFYDVLTGLPNERLFLDRLTQFLHANKPGSLVAVIMIDLNRFSQLNDALGRHAGDDLLKQIARCLTDALKDPVSIARIGRDIFAIALPDLSHGTDAATALEQKIFAALDRQFILSEQDIRVSARAGLALYPLDGHDPEVLFKHAEAALRNAKSSGKRYAYYAPEMNAALSARLSLENELRLALETGQFMLVFQPRVDISTGCIIGAEALIRWRHPQSGMVMPSAFIPLAEEIGFIVLIDEWVAGSVCAQQAAWLKQGVEIVPISINLSAVQFKHGNVIKTITDAIETHGIECHHIEAELTESAVMEDPNEAARALNTLKDMGILLALDDFGTGYSSLAYLKRFPFDFVKIDRAFITDITTNSGDAAIATAVIAMAHSLDMRVVAEGVETGNQLAFLRGQGCDAIQGYYFSQPVPAEKFEAMLREKKQLSSVHL